MRTRSFPFPLSVPVICLLPLVLLSCEEKGSGIVMGGAGAVANCDLTIATLPDTEWVIYKILPDKTEAPDYKTRMKFFKEDGQLKVKYNVGSLSDIYTYGCEEKDNELTCREEARPKDWCQALLVGGAQCNAEVIKTFDPTLSDDVIAKAIEEATANVAKYKDTDNWKQFELNNNNLGNKLQGLLYAKVDARRCRLRITDNYMTIYKGKRVEDSNPVGTNAFVKWDGSKELLWEHCTDSGDVAPVADAPYPKDLSHVPLIHQATFGQEVNFWYLGDDGRTPVEGCDYSYDLWFDGTDPQRGLKPEIVDVKHHKKELRWHWSHAWTEPNMDGMPLAGTTFIHRMWTCADPTKSGEELSCAAVRIN
ncbi:MAG: hypothetical protein GXP62_17425 [Oligoflexia bacterium]|nr:hypothetical protein [Oligoflexia bacterium]